MAYAHKSEVSVERSKIELDTLLGKAGATSRGFFADDDAGHVQVFFRLGAGSYRLVVPHPKLGDFPASGEAPPGWHEWSDAKRAEWRYRKWEQACRSRWRVVLLLVKSKLEMVALGASTVEREFMADLLLSNGKTVHENVTGRGPQLLLPPAGDR